MRQCNRWTGLARKARLPIGLSLAILASPAPAAGPECDRKCLAGVADRVLASIVAHDAARMPLATDYAATENLVPSTPAMMTPWRTVTAIRAHRYYIDPVTQQLFIVATAAEGRQDALLYGRIALRDRRIAELELYVNRSRGQSGLMFDPAGSTHLPSPWSKTVSAGRRASRADLIAIGKTMFDSALNAPAADPDCVVVETGKGAHLSLEMQAAVTRSSAVSSPSAGASKTVAVSCENVAHRPNDPEARADLVDEEQSVVIGMAIVRGMVSSYLAPTPPESNFLPDGYYARYRSLQDKQRAAIDPATPILRPMAAHAAVSQIYRIYDGRIQGFQRFILVVPGGSISPWPRARP